MDMLLNFGLQVLDFLLMIPLILMTITFDVIKPLLWVIIPLIMINWFLKRLFNTSLMQLLARSKYVK
jgi:hypothetical protein